MKAQPQVDRTMVVSRYAVTPMYPNPDTLSENTSASRTLQNAAQLRQERIHSLTDHTAFKSPTCEGTATRLT